MKKLQTKEVFDAKVEISPAKKKKTEQAICYICGQVIFASDDKATEGGKTAHLMCFIEDDAERWGDG